MHRTGSVTRTQRRTRSTLIWASGLVGVVVAALVVTTVVVLGRSGSGAVPVVSDVRASVAGNSVTFRWQDPGLRDGDTYVVSTNGSATQQSGTSFVVSGSRGDEECLSVAVNRDGKTGAASPEKCVTIGDGS